MIFGHVQAHVHTIEFQKRGLPHCHMLFILDNHNNMWQDVDNVICAELPDPVSSPRLYDIVKRCMIHGPCGVNLNPRSPCMGDDHRCRKGFPKDFCIQTTIGEDNYPTYRQRSPANGGYTSLATIHRGKSGGSSGGQPFRRSL